MIYLFINKFISKIENILTLPEQINLLSVTRVEKMRIGHIFFWLKNNFGVKKLFKYNIL